MMFQPEVKYASEPYSILDATTCDNLIYNDAYDYEW